MTERIDLDDLDVEPSEESDDRPNRGDWFWQGEGDPEEEPDAADVWSAGTAADTGDESGPGADDAADDRPDASATADRDHQPAPRVPSETDGAPVGIPIQQGGAGGGSPEREADARAASGAEPAAEDDDAGADDMTLAFTYGAIGDLPDPRAAVADAEGWSDWIGIVGDVGAHVINKFQRDHAVDVDFFNGSGTGPGERLAEIDERSMFHADRMVVVGREGEDEHVAERAGWEFVPLREAAEKADWKLADE